MDSFFLITEISSVFKLSFGNNQPFFSKLAINNSLCFVAILSSFVLNDTSITKSSSNFRYYLMAKFQYLLLCFQTLLYIVSLIQDSKYGNSLTFPLPICIQPFVHFPGNFSINMFWLTCSFGKSSIPYPLAL